MSKRVTRRGLLGGVFESLRDEPAVRPAERAATGFSLQAFYAGREPPAAELPFVAVREGLPCVATTAVGVCPPIEPRDDDGGLS